MGKQKPLMSLILTGFGILLIGISAANIAYGVPRIFSNNRAYAGTYFTATYGGVTANDRINFVGIAKMINQADPNTITNDEYNRFANTNEQSTLTIPKFRLISFCNRKGFGGKSFLNYITNYTEPGVGSNDIRLKDFGEEICRRSGTPNGSNGFTTTITRMAAFATPDNPNPAYSVSSRFTIWLGLPVIVRPDNRPTPSDENIYAAHKAEIDASIAGVNIWRSEGTVSLKPIYGNGYIIYLQYDRNTGSLDKYITRDNGLTENDLKIFSPAD